MKRVGKSLSIRQAAVLELLYRYRYLNSSHLQSFTTTTAGVVQNRLAGLLKRGLIARDYSSTSRLRNDFAIYYLTPASIPDLSRTLDTNGKSMFKFIYTNGVSSELVKSKSLLIATTAIVINKEGYKVFTSKELTQFDYFPTRKPDLYITRKTEDSRINYFLYVVDATNARAIIEPFVKYDTFFKSSDWEDATGTGKPPLLIAVSDSHQRTAVIKKGRQYLFAVDSEIEEFYLLKNYEDEETNQGSIERIDIS